MAKISIKTIAEKLNLSPGTVSIVLNGRGDEMRIAKATQERVLEEARSIGYQPNIYARRLRQKSAGDSAAIIGVLWPSLFSSEVLVRFFEGIQHTVLEDKINVEVVYKPYHYTEVYKISDVFKNNMFNGVIVVGASDSDVEYIKGENCTMPIVFFNRQNEKYSSVCIDDYNTGSKVAELFHARGHQNVGIVESDLMMRHHSLRKFGFTETCQRYGLTLSQSNIIRETIAEEGGARAAHKLIKSGKLPTALFFSMGSMASGAYPVFEEHGIRIPEDMEIIGYGDSAIKAQPVGRRSAGSGNRQKMRTTDH